MRMQNVSEYMLVLALCLVGYSSSMLDCTSNRTLKQEHTTQNYNTPVTHNIQ